MKWYLSQDGGFAGNVGKGEKHPGRVIGMCKGPGETVSTALYG